MWKAYDGVECSECGSLWVIMWMEFDAVEMEYVAGWRWKWWVME